MRGRRRGRAKGRKASPRRRSLKAEAERREPYTKQASSHVRRLLASWVFLLAGFRLRPGAFLLLFLLLPAFSSSFSGPQLLPPPPPRPLKPIVVLSPLSLCLFALMPRRALEPRTPLTHTPPRCLIMHSGGQAIGLRHASPPLLKRRHKAGG